MTLLDVMICKLPPALYVSSAQNSLFQNTILLYNLNSLIPAFQMWQVA
jgi:hypothetical protein